MNPFLWILWGFLVIIVLITIAACLDLINQRRKRNAATKADASYAAKTVAGIHQDETGQILAAVIDLHRPQVMDRRHDSDVHSTITTICGTCSNSAGEPVPFPCATMGTIRRERQRVRGQGA